MPERTCVMISSTLLDLPEHRQDVLEACLRQGMQPMCLDDLPPFDASKFEPMPEVEINPHDEFYVEETEDR